MWAADVWARLRTAIEGELDHEDGWVHQLVGDAMVRAAATLEGDQAMRAAIDRAVLRLARQALPGMRDYLSGFIAEVVGGWDTDRLVDRIELMVGGDLQFVRINGTMVGCLVGILLYGVSWMLLGAQAG